MESLLPSMKDLTLSEEEIQDFKPGEVLNINIGILGHIDSGKTSLAKALSKVTSTASLDKNPQSQERGITLDLGFSAFFTRFPKSKSSADQYKYIQYTLVDCPGHASLIKTIIGGASIIDLMFLVIDVTKGIQTQTAECLVIGELLIPKLIVVLNKIDQIPQEEREASLEKKIAGFRKIFSKTKFGSDVPIVPISAVGNENGPMNIDLLILKLTEAIEIPVRQLKGPFFFLIDHCFPMKGQGSVVTGTVIQGTVKTGDEVSFPQINEVKKIKSIQVFKKPVPSIRQGDRAGILFTQLDAKQIERGIACEPGAVKPYNVLLIDITKVSYFKGSISNKGKFHITSGHQTVMATLKLFGYHSNSSQIQMMLNQTSPQQGLEAINSYVPTKFNYDLEYTFETELPLKKPGDGTKKEPPQEEMKKDELEAWEKSNEEKVYFAVLELDTPLLCNLGAFIMGSKFDTAITSNTCRIAFHGHVIDLFDEKNITDLAKLRVCSIKKKVGHIDRIADPRTIIAKDLFWKDTDVNKFIGKPVKLAPQGITGVVTSLFGQKGKIKVTLDKELPLNKNDKEASESLAAANEVIMEYKKYYSYKAKRKAN